MSACLNGQTGPHKDYPGFGGQGSALAGYNALTGWPDREPVGPYGTITDSLAPRYVAAALAAGLHYRRRTGHGVYLDLSQVESAIWTLAPWLLDYEVDGVIRLRDGNDHRGARAARRVRVRRRGRHRAIAGSRSRAGPTTSWPGCTRSRATTSRRGHAPAGVSRSPSNCRPSGSRPCRCSDFGDLNDDPQLAHRGHFEPLTHPFLGPGLYERNGFRLAACPGGYDTRRPDARPGQRMGARRGARPERVPRSRHCGRPARWSELGAVQVRRVTPDDRTWIAEVDRR